MVEHLFTIMSEIRLTKKFTEELGMLKIKKYWDSYVPGFVRCERPDWINLQTSTGIEITRAMHEQEGEVINLLSRYAGKSKNQLPSALQNKFDGQLGYDDNGRLNVASSTKGLTNSSFFLNKLISTINNKTEKLQTYKKLNINVLYVFYGYIFSNHDIKNLTKHIFSERCLQDRYFNIIIVDDNELLFFFDLDTKTYKQIDILDNDDSIKTVEGLFNNLT